MHENLQRKLNKKTKVEHTRGGVVTVEANMSGSRQFNRGSAKVVLQSPLANVGDEARKLCVLGMGM
jgi:hypothetical protein